MRTRLFLSLAKFKIKMTNYGLKYRRLSSQELEQLKDDFVKFLATNSIAADDWEQMKKEDNDKAIGMIDIFSNMVFDRAISNIKFLELRTEKELRVFKCNEEDIHLVGLTVDESKDLDFTSGETLKQLASGEILLENYGPKMYTSEKKYEDSRAQELFKMMDMGCVPAPESLYMGLKSMIKG